MLLLFFVFLTLCLYTSHAIDRKAIVARYNPVRNASSLATPLQVGNGFFAFGTDVTSLQTFQPYAIMSSSGWKNDSLPANRTMQDVLEYRGVTGWWNHDRLVQYEFNGEPDIQQWLISNPNRVNFARTGLVFFDESGAVQDVIESDLANARQQLDLWTGSLSSTFTFQNQPITVTAHAHESQSTVSVQLSSPLLQSGRLGVFIDFPWNDGSSKFSAPFVGYWNQSEFHTTALQTKHPLAKGARAQIIHTLVENQFTTSIGGDSFSVTRDSPTAHRYTIRPIQPEPSLTLSLGFGTKAPSSLPSSDEVVQSSRDAWESYWMDSGFVDVLTGSTDPRADELQRRIILSRYLVRVNEPSQDSPQESGLVNNGWYGKFHLEMVFWHLCHFALWNNFDLLNRAMPMYRRFLPTSIERAQVQQGWPAGARWGKMSDPSGRSAPGEINELLIWQQPHPLVFAEYAYRHDATYQTLQIWRDIVVQTADWMAAFAWFNTSTGVYDLGPPMYVVSEDTQPNITRNPAFELAYWRYGLQLASSWMERLGEEVPSKWVQVREGLAPLPIEDGLYAVYEGIPSNFWDTPTYTNDHPALVGLHGWLPEVPGVNLTIAKATAEKVWTHWNLTNSYGWDYPMLALSAARNGNPEQALDFLLDDLFSFDDAGYPTGGVRVPTPYMPSAGSFLYAIGMMVGWDGSEGVAPGFPANGWNVTHEGMNKAL